VWPPQTRSSLADRTFSLSDHCFFFLFKYQVIHHTNRILCRPNNHRCRYWFLLLENFRLDSKMAFYYHTDILFQLLTLWWIVRTWNYPCDLRRAFTMKKDIASYIIIIINRSWVKQFVDVRRSEFNHGRKRMIEGRETVKKKTQTKTNSSCDSFYVFNSINVKNRYKVEDRALEECETEISAHRKPSVPLMLVSFWWFHWWYWTIQLAGN